MKTPLVLAAAAIAAFSSLGCAPNAKSGRGFQLPPGNAQKGQVAFVQLKCTECHRVDGVQLPAPTAKPELVVTLGGEVSRIRTYGQLVTAIIHPSVALSDKFIPPASVTDSPMKNFNREMTVEQLVDIVTFLSPTYRAMLPLAEPSS